MLEQSGFPRFKRLPAAPNGSYSYRHTLQTTSNDFRLASLHPISPLPQVDRHSLPHHAADRLHAEKGAAGVFIEISTSAGVLRVTSDHLVFLDNGKAVPASVIRPGYGLSSGSVVGTKEVRRSTGIYAPITKSGTIEVEEK